MAGFKTGDVRRNEIIPQKGAPLCRSPVSTGIVEQEQNGVITPRIAPKTLFKGFTGVESIFFIRIGEI